MIIKNEKELEFQFRIFLELIKKDIGFVQASKDAEKAVDIFLSQLHVMPAHQAMNAMTNMLEALEEKEEVK
jgi:hypothetical protein